MNNEEKLFFQKELSGLATKLETIKTENRTKWQERNKIYEERKINHDKRLDDLQDNVKKLFEKTDIVEATVNTISVTVVNAVTMFNTSCLSLQDKILTEADLPCKIHLTKVESIEKDVSRLFKWVFSIIVGILGAAYAVSKK